MSARTLLGRTLLVLLVATLAGGASPVSGQISAPADVSAAAFCDSVTEIPQAECQALVDLYNGTTGASWTHRNGWLRNYTPCSWYGVICDSGHVYELHLDGNNLTGGIPSTLGNLYSLVDLELYSNHLDGGIPTSLGNLLNLRVLFLQGNELNGGIPTNLGSLSHLEKIALCNNQLTGGIPTNLGNLSNLQALYLSGNQLNGGIPTELGNLSSLLWLYLHNNQLTGGIPSSLGSLSTLQNLFLCENQLNGSIPTTLGNLSNLLMLLLNDNQLTGGIPTNLGNLSNLQALYLQNNQLNGSIPDSLGNLSYLWYLDLSDNQLNGSIPTTLGNLSSIEYLLLGGNQLSGGIPSSLSNLPILFSLSLERNQLTGGIPAGLGDLPLFRNLKLNDNPLGGALPANLTNLTLWVFHFNNTSLCEPPDAAFQSWLASISDLQRTGVLCAVATPTPTATQGAPTVTSTRTPTRTPTRTATPTRTLTGTPRPETSKKVYLPVVMKQHATGGQVIFFEDFNDGDLAGWTPHNGIWANAGTYLRGEYVGGEAWNMRAESGSNFTYEGTVNLLGGTAVGLTFRSSADGTLSYDVMLDPEESVFKISKRSPYQMLAEYGMEVLRNHQYRIKVVANGSTIETYLDGVKRLTVTDSTYASGQFGVMLFVGMGAYDNLEAKSLP